nr:type III secretion system chaperone [Sodalis ligni]
MTFEELLNSLALDTHLDIHDATESGGCTIRFDQHINITLERHDKWVYLFSPVMPILHSLPEDFSHHYCKSIFLALQHIIAGSAMTRGDNGFYYSTHWILSRALRKTPWTVLKHL